METRTQRRNTNRGSVGTPSTSIMTLDLALLTKHMDKVVYGEGGGPLYDLLDIAGTVKMSNTPETAMDGDFFQLRNAMKTGQASFVYGMRDSIQAAIKTSDTGVLFAGVYHDADGNAVPDVELTVCAVITNRKFEFTDDETGELVTIEKGRKFLKALPGAYVAKLKKAA